MFAEPLRSAVGMHPARLQNWQRPPSADIRLRSRTSQPTPGSANPRRRHRSPDEPAAASRHPAEDRQPPDPGIQAPADERHVPARAKNRSPDADRHSDSSPQQSTPAPRLTFISTKVQLDGVRSGRVDPHVIDRRDALARQRIPNPQLIEQAAGRSRQGEKPENPRAPMSASLRYSTQRRPGHLRDHARARRQTGRRARPSARPKRRSGLANDGDVKNRGFEIGLIHSKDLIGTIIRSRILIDPNPTPGEPCRDCRICQFSAIGYTTRPLARSLYRRPADVLKSGKQTAW